MRHLGGDEDLLAFDARGVQSLAHFALVAVDQRAIEMAIAEFQGLLDDARADAAVELPGPEPEYRNFRAIRFYRLHVHSFLYVPFRRLRRIDHAPVGALERRDLVHLGRSEREIQHLEVFLLPLRLAGAR